MSVSRPQQSNSSRVDLPTAGVGGGAGTLMIWFAQEYIGSETPLYKLAVFTAPWITIAAGVLWAGFLVWAKRHWLKRMLRNRINEMSEMLRSASDNPEVDEGTRELIKEALSGLQRKQVEVVTSDIDEIRDLITNHRQN